MSDASAVEWSVFGAVLLLLLGADLFSHRGGRLESRRQALVWSGLWVAAGLGFCAFVWWRGGSGDASDYLAAYLIEKSLSVDNLVVFLVIFQSLAIPQDCQRRVLSWGVLGALALRALFVFLGAAALRDYHWVAYVFGGILLLAAWKSARDDPARTQRSPAVSFLSRHLPVTSRVHGRRFVAREEGRRVVTPLLIAVLGLEATDLVFAVDSVPAALSVTRAEFLVYSSNAFAILGLRSLYLVLAHSLGDLPYLHYGVAGVLAFAGTKLLSAQWIEIPAGVSIAVVAGTIAIAVGASLRAREGRQPSGAGEATR